MMMVVVVMMCGLPVTVNDDQIWCMLYLWVLV